MLFVAVGMMLLVLGGFLFLGSLDQEKSKKILGLFLILVGLGLVSVLVWPERKEKAGVYEPRPLNPQIGLRNFV